MRLFSLLLFSLIILSACNNGRPSGLRIKYYFVDFENAGHLESPALALFSDKTVIAAASLWTDDMQSYGTIDFEEKIRLYRMTFGAKKPVVSELGKGICIGFCGTDEAMLCGVVRKIPDEKGAHWRTVFFVSKDQGKTWDSTGMLPFRIQKIFKGYQKERLLLVTAADSFGMADVLYTQNFGVSCEKLCSDYNPTGLQETADNLLMTCDSNSEFRYGNSYIAVFSKANQTKRILKFNTGFRPILAGWGSGQRIITAGEILNRFYLAEQDAPDAKPHYQTFEEAGSLNIHSIYKAGPEMWLMGYGSMLHRQDDKSNWEHNSVNMGTIAKELYIVNETLMVGLGISNDINSIQLIYKPTNH